MDDFKPVANNSKHSSSAVDTLTVLYSVKKFWEDLKWPNEDEAMKMTTNVSGDICRFAAIYYDNLVDRIEKSDARTHFGIFQVPLEVFIAICNIDFVSRGIQKLVEPAENGILPNERVKRVVEITLNHGKTRVERLMLRSIKKMITSLRKLLLEGAEVPTRVNEVGERVILYIDDALVSFEKDLYEKDFITAKRFLWESILDIFTERISKSLETKREPVFFSNLKTIFDEIQKVFVNSAEIDNSEEKMTKIRFLLERHCLNTSKLVHQYFKDRYHIQQTISKSPFHPYGVLSIKCFFFHNFLKIEVLNAKNLVPIGGFKKCDSFVKINIVPKDFFPNCQNFKTKVEAETHFPLYEELFEM